MEHCPACGVNMRLAKLHCNNAECVWLVCGGCDCIVSDTGAYFGVLLWGNEHGYLKADG